MGAWCRFSGTDLLRQNRSAERPVGLTTPPTPCSQVAQVVPVPVSVRVCLWCSWVFCGAVVLLLGAGIRFCGRSVEDLHFAETFHSYSMLLFRLVQSFQLVPGLATIIGWI